MRSDRPAPCAWVWLSVLLLALACSLIASSASADDSVVATWVPTKTVPPQSFQYLDLFAEGTGYAYVAQESSLQKTTDFGMTWSDATAPSAPGPVVFADPATGFAIPFGVSSNGFLRTDDGASTWTETASPPRGAAYDDHRLYAIDAVNSLIAIGGVQVASGSEKTTKCEVPQKIDLSFWFSRSDGRAWRRYQRNSYGTPFKIDVLDKRTAAAIVYEQFVAGLDTSGDCMLNSSANSIYVTTDGGKKWVRRISFSAPDYATAIEVVDHRTILVGTNDGRLLRSADSGKSFDVLHRFPHEARRPVDEAARAFWVAAIDFANERVGYLSTKGSGTYRTDDGGLTWALELSHELGWGIGAGDLAVAGPDHAITGGPNFVSSRIP